MRRAFLLAAVAMSCRFGFDDAARNGLGDAAVDGAGDASEDAPPPPNLVFVSSSAQAAASLGGLPGADALCTQLATAASRPGTYVAWLSATGANAKDRLGMARGWVRFDDMPVVDTVADLTAGALVNPILYDEQGVAHLALNDYTVTATRPDGTLADTAPCSDWTANTTFPTYGIPSSSNSQWTTWGAVTGCTNLTRIYCFGVDWPERADEAPCSVSGSIDRSENGAR